MSQERTPRRTAYETRPNQVSPEAQQQLQRSVERDALTDALSRRTMMERLDTAAACCGSQPVALFFVDLDGFKAVNDRLGHREGDALLVREPA